MPGNTLSAGSIASGLYGGKNILPPKKTTGQLWPK